MAWLLDDHETSKWFSTSMIISESVIGTWDNWFLKAVRIVAKGLAQFEGQVAMGK